MAKTINYLDKHGLGTVLKLLKKRTSDVYVIKGSGIYADPAFLALAADAKEAIAEGASVINAAGLWQRRGGVWTQVTDVQPGWVYSIKNNFITDAQFVEGANYKVADGTNIVVVNEGTEAAPVLKWDLLARTLDLDEYQKKLLEEPLEVFDNDHFHEVFPDYAGAVGATPLPTQEVKSFGATLPAEEVKAAAEARADEINSTVAVMEADGAGYAEGDVFRAVTSIEKPIPDIEQYFINISWVKLGDQHTVEGALALLSNVCPNTPISDKEIEDIFNSL